MHAICHQAVKLRGVNLRIESRPPMQGVVAGVTKQFVTQVRDQLQAMRTAELSLQKVRKNRAADASADSAKTLSDVDKVNAQLFLDAQV